jgi:hypothetical protein
MVEQNEEKSLDIVQEARIIRDEIIQAKNELKAEKEALLKARAEQLLSGTSGGHIEAQPAPRLTNKEYAAKLMRGEVNPLKEDGISIN